MKTESGSAWIEEDAPPLVSWQHWLELGESSSKREWVLFPVTWRDSFLRTFLGHKYGSIIGTLHEACALLDFRSFHSSSFFATKVNLRVHVNVRSWLKCNFDNVAGVIGSTAGVYLSCSESKGMNSSTCGNWCICKVVWLRRGEGGMCDVRDLMTNSALGKVWMNKKHNFIGLAKKVG